MPLEVFSVFLVSDVIGISFFLRCQESHSEIFSPENSNMSKKRLTIGKKCNINKFINRKNMINAGIGAKFIFQSFSECRFGKIYFIEYYCKILNN